MKKMLISLFTLSLVAMSMAAAPYGLPNLVQDGDIEFTQPFEFWWTSNPAQAVTDYSQSATADGTGCLVMTPDATTTPWLDVAQNFHATKANYNYMVPVEPNDLLICKFMVKTEGATLADPGNFSFITSWYDVAADGTTKTFIGHPTPTAIALTGGVWQEVTHAVQVESNSDINFVQLLFRCYTGAEGTFKIDDVQCYVVKPADLPDLKNVAFDWLTMEQLPLSDYIIDDFEYVDPPAGPNFMSALWMPYSTAANDYGDPQISLVTDPLEGDKCLRFDYTQDEANLGNGKVCWNDISHILEGGLATVDLTQYDEMHLKIYRPLLDPEVTTANIYVKPYSGTWAGDVKLLSNYSAYPIQSPAADTTNYTGGAWDDLIIDLSEPKQVGQQYYESFTACQGFMFGMSSNNKFDPPSAFGTGYLLLDDLKFVQTKPRCSGAVSPLDLNGDCNVNIMDAALIGYGWLQ